MQYGGPAASKLRAALAATLVPTWGIYSGYELIEHVARPGAEEQIDNEKYQFKTGTGRTTSPAASRRASRLAVPHPAQRDPPRAPALHWLRNITFHHVDDAN